MKYLLLGGAGVFALHTAKYLLEQEDTELVICIGRNTVKNPAFNLDIGKNDKRYIFKPCHIVYEQDFLFEYFDNYKPDFVINFAALAYATSWDKSFRYYDTNITAVAKICEFLSKKNYLKKFLQIGTSELYGPVTSPVDEKYPINPTSPYSVSKFALNGISKNIAVEYGNKKIISNCVIPGFVDTKLTRKNLNEKYIKKIISKTPTKKLITKSQIAYVVDFLLSDFSNGINGQEIIVDGGISSSGKFYN